MKKMYSAHNGHISETLTQNITKIILNSNNLIEVPQNIKNDGWLVRFGITCHICCTVWHSKKDFDSHFSRDHDGTITYTCTSCGKRMDNYHNYRSHCYRHGTQLKCPHCDKSYPELSRLVIHVNANHIGETEDNEDTLSVRTKNNKKKQFECPKCPKKLVSVSGLQFHIKTNHQSELPLAASQDFTCEECGKVLKSLAGLQSHTAVHQSAKHYACNFCKKIFLQPAALRKHTQTEHTGHKPYSCALCPLEFDTESSLKKHLPFHNEEREFPCTICNKCFKTKRCLKVHSRLHLKVTSDVLCPTCGKRFFNSTKLRQHINIHNGERPYPCKYCKSTFTNFSNWKKHTERMHKVDHKTGELLTDFHPKKYAKNNNNETNNDHNSMYKVHEKEIFNANNLFDDANQKTINADQSSSLAPFSAKKHDLGIFDNNGNYKDEIKKETKTFSMENSDFINFSNLHKRVKLDTIIPKKNTSYNNYTNNTGTDLQDNTVSPKNNNMVLSLKEINSECETLTLGKNGSSVNIVRCSQSKNSVHSDKNVLCDSISLDSKVRTDSVQFSGLEKDFTASVVSTSKTVRFTNNVVTPLQTTSNSPMLLMVVPTANNTNISVSSMSLNTLNKNYATLANTIEPDTLNSVHDKLEGQKYINNDFEPERKFEDDNMSEDQLLNENKHENNVSTKNMTHKTLIIVVYDDLQENHVTDHNLHDDFTSEQKKHEIINNNSTYGTDNIKVQKEQFESSNMSKQQKLIFHEFSNRKEVEKRVVTDDNIEEGKTVISNFVLQAQLSPDGVVVKKQEFINGKQKQIVNRKNIVQENDLTKLDMIDIHISKEAALMSNGNIIQENEISNNSVADSEMFKNNVVQKNEAAQETTDYTIAKVVHLLNKNISDDIKFNDNKKSTKIPQEKEINLQDETIINKKYRQEELGSFKNNTNHEMLNNNELERGDFVSENCQKKNSEVTYTSVNLTSALGLDEGSLLAHIDPHLTFKLSQNLESHTSLSNSELHLTNDFFVDNICDSSPESLLSSGTETLLMNCRNLRTMIEDDTRSSQRIEPMDIFDQDFLNIDVQDVLETLKSITSTEEIDSFLNLQPINEGECNAMLDVLKEPQPYISGDFLVVPPPLEM